MRSLFVIGTGMSRSTNFLVYRIFDRPPKFFCHAAIDGEVDAAVEDEQDLGDAARDHGPQGDGEAAPLLAIAVLLQS